MLTMILGFLGGPLLNNLLGAYKARLENASGQDKMAVELAIKEIEAEIVSRTEATKIMMLENGRWWTWMPRAAVQWAAAIVFVKCTVWDNILGLGSTDPLHGDIAATYTMVMAMWFGGRTIEKVAQVFGRRN